MSTKSMKKRVIPILMTFMLLIGLIPANVFADTKVTISSASQLPTEIAAGTTYELAGDIALTSDQQIESIAGTLDGKGYVITLGGKPLANNVSGTIQNLGVKGDAGSVSGNAGTIAVKLSGTIRNCYSTASISTSGWDDMGGIAGLMTSGSVNNCYYAGSFNPSYMGGGIVGYAEGGSVSNVCYTAGYAAINMGRVSPENAVKKSSAEMGQTAAVEVLNTDIAETGYYWAIQQGNSLPSLKAGSISDLGVDKTQLEAMLNSVKELNKELYTSDSWDALKAAVTDAEKVAADEEASQKQVNEGLKALEAAVNGLEKKKAEEPVAKPGDESKIVHISSQAELEAVGNGNKDKYYILDCDITTDDCYMSFDEFNGVFDGNGHTVTFNNSYTGLFYGIGKEGVVQNVHFKGSLKNGHGACGTGIKGAVINCYTEVTGTNAAGFANRLNGGIISNCYSISKAGNGPVVALANASNTGTLKNVYWQEGLAFKADIDALTVKGTAVALDKSAMKSMDFVDTLNENKGENGISWGQSSSGYPYFGDNEEYIPDSQKPLPENEAMVSFLANGETEAVSLTEQKITVDRNIADAWDIVGTFKLEDYELPEGAKIEWDTPDTDMSVMDIDMSSGELFAYKNGEGKVTATLIDKDGNRKLIATVYVISMTEEIEDIKLYLTDSNRENVKEIKDGKVSLQGSEVKYIVIKAKYEGENLYKAISNNDFVFEVTENKDIVKHTEGSSSFSFKEPGMAKITVTHKTNDNLEKSFEATSEYVAVESIKPGIEGKIIIHGRNANSTDKAYLPEYTGVVVTPENASYSGNFTITSSDPETAEYVSSMVVGYVPYKAGKVTFTAEADDVKGESQVEYVYKNPLKSVTAKEKEIVIAAGEKVSANLIFEGESDKYTVTETGMQWTFDKDGIVKIIRENGGFKMEDGEKLYFLSSDYTFQGLSEGTVTVTGTPVDTTCGADAVTIKITVLAGNRQPADIDKILSNGIEKSTKYLKEQLPSKPTFGYEWNIIALLRADKKISDSQLNAYYKSVEEEVKSWPASSSTRNIKPTEAARTALAMTIMGKDITDIGGVDVAELLYNNDRITSSSNEAAYALLALDAAEAEIPANAKWSREKLIKEMLKYQNEEGFFGLVDNEKASMDMTCMILQALAPYKEAPEVKKAINKALSHIKEEISGNYDYNDSNATAQILLSVAVLGLDITEIDNGLGNRFDNIITRLDEYSTKDGFSYLFGGKTDGMATYQVMQAFDAYRKMKDEGISYWDFKVSSNNVYEDEEDDIIKDTFNPITPETETNSPIVKDENDDFADAFVKEEVKQNEITPEEGSLNDLPLEDNEENSIYKSVQTGDTFPILLLSFIAMIAVMIACLSLRKRKVSGK